MTEWAKVALWTVLLTILFAVSSRADDIAFKYGMGVDPNGDRNGQVKIFSFRHERHEFYAFHTAREAGLWVDNLGNGRASAGFGKYQIGVKPGPDVGFYGTAMWGVQLQSSTDTLLGGYAQFSQDFGVGYRDETSFIAVGYGHVSSAGIFMPNRGRDFQYLQLGVRF